MTIEKLDGDRVAVSAEAMRELLEKHHPVAIPAMTDAELAAKWVRMFPNDNNSRHNALRFVRALLASQPSAQPSEAIAKYLFDLIAEPSNAEIRSAARLLYGWYMGGEFPVDVPQVAQPSAEAMPLGYVSSDQLASWPHTGGSISLWRKPFGNYTVPVFTTQPSSQPQEARETVAGAQGVLTADEISALKKVKWSADHLCRTINLSIADVETLAAMADRLASAQPIVQKPVAGVRWDLFPGWLIDHREGDAITEEGLQKALSDMLAHDKANNCPKCGQDWSEHEMGVPAPYCPVAQPSTTDSDVRDAAQAVVREALDRVTVHPCDEHNDEVRSNALVGPMADLYRALKSSPPATEAGEQQ